MLLPSALDCAPRTQPVRSVYSASKDLLSPPQCTVRPSTLPVFNTCRALQSLLTTSLAPSALTNQKLHTPISLASPIDLDSTKHTPKPKSSQRTHWRTATHAPSLRTPPPALKKRRRSEYETDDTPSQDTEAAATTTAPSTPKRQRLCPPTLPLGLNLADFESIQEEAAEIPIPQTPAFPAPCQPATNRTTTTAPEQWASPDDSALVSLILRKLRLRQSDWDDCARQLGRDSIGERFKLLLGDDSDLALRRGKGRRSRGQIATIEFDGPLLNPGGEVQADRQQH